MGYREIVLTDRQCEKFILNINKISAILPYNKGDVNWTLITVGKTSYVCTETINEVRNMIGSALRERK